MALNNKFSPQDDNSLSPLSNLYFSIFVLFYRLLRGLWPAQFNADAHKGVAGVSFVEWLLLLSLFEWVQIGTGHRFGFGQLTAAVVLLVGFFVNYYFLIVLRFGLEFEKQFNHFSLARRVALRGCAIAFVLIAVAVFYLSTIRYQQTFSLR